MEFDFVYADLRVQVIFKAEDGSPLSRLTDREVLVLQQIMYNTLSVFCMVRGFYAADVVALQRRIDAEKKTLNKEPDGG